MFIFTIKSVPKSAQFVKIVKRPSTVTTLETKLKIIAHFEAAKRAAIINVEAHLRC
jgi:hypothetical protein